LALVHIFLAEGKITIFLMQLVVGRALSLALSNVVRPRAITHQSDRKSLLSMLQTQMNHLNPNEDCVVVMGPKGVGKSLLIDTYARRRAGVVWVDISAGASSTEIKRTVHRKIAGLKSIVTDCENGAVRVVWWYHLLMRKPPTVIIRAEEVRPGHERSDLAGIARSLASVAFGGGVNLIIDAPDNSVHHSVIATKRERVVSVELMTREEFDSAAELKAIRERLDRLSTPEVSENAPPPVKLGEVAWLILGGNPKDWRNLAEFVQNAPDDATAIQTASTFLQKTLDKAMAQVGAARDMFENVLQEIKTVGSFRVRCLSSPQRVALARSVKALRMSQVSDVALVVAASPAVELVLRQDYKDRIPSFQELQAVLDRCARDSAQN